MAFFLCLFILLDNFEYLRVLNFKEPTRVYMYAALFICGGASGRWRLNMALCVSPAALLAPSLRQVRGCCCSGLGAQLCLPSSDVQHAGLCALCATGCCSQVLVYNSTSAEPGVPVPDPKIPVLYSFIFFTSCPQTLHIFRLTLDF